MSPCVLCCCVHLTRADLRSSGGWHPIVQQVKSDYDVLFEGTPLYCRAPGTVCSSTTTESKAVGKTDIWSLGCMLLEMYMGCTWPSAGAAAKLFTVRPYSGPLPAALADVIKRCLDSEPALRPTASDVKQVDNNCFVCTWQHSLSLQCQVNVARHALPKICVLMYVTIHSIHVTVYKPSLLCRYCRALYLKQVSDVQDVVGYCKALAHCLRTVETLLSEGFIAIFCEKAITSCHHSRCCRSSCKLPRLHVAAEDCTCPIPHVQHQT